MKINLKCNNVFTELCLCMILPIILFFSLISRKGGSSETDSIRSATISKRNYGQSRASLLFGAEPIGAVAVKAPTPPTRTPPPPRYMFYYVAEFEISKPLCSSMLSIKFKKVTKVAEAPGCSFSELSGGHFYNIHRQRSVKNTL